MCADAQQFSHRSCQTCQTATNDIKLDQLNIKGTFKTKTGNNQRIKGAGAFHSAGQSKEG